MRFRFLLGLAAVAVGASSNAFVYQYDDGVSDLDLSTSGPPTFNVLFLTNYTTAAGGETVTSIDVVWGARTNPNLPNGLTADVLLMDDPNGDGNPNDASVIRSVLATTINVGTDTFNNYGIAPLTMSVGTSFFVGAFIHDVPTGSSWMAIDGNATGMGPRNWWNVAIGSPVGNHLPLSIFGNDLTAMVRANAVPEPATLMALASGAALLLRRRARR